MATVIVPPEGIQRIFDKLGTTWTREEIDAVCNWLYENPSRSDPEHPSPQYSRLLATALYGVQSTYAQASWQDAEDALQEFRASGRLEQVIKGYQPRMAGRLWEVTVESKQEESATKSEQESATKSKQRGSKYRTLMGHTKAVSAVAISDDAQTVMTGSEDESIIVWQASSGMVLKSPAQRVGTVRAVVFGHDNSAAFSADDNCMLRRWQLSDGSMVWERKAPASVRSIAIASDDCYLATGGQGATLDLWDAMSGTHSTLSAQGAESGHGDDVMVVAFAPNSQWLASGSQDKTTRLWSVPDGKLLCDPLQHSAAILSLGFSADGKILACGCADGSVYLWDVALASTACAQALQVKVISKDGKVLAIGSALDHLLAAAVDVTGKRVLIRNVTTDAHLPTLEVYRGPVRCLAFANDADLLVAGIEDTTPGNFLSWLLQPNSLPSFCRQHGKKLAKKYRHELPLEDHQGEGSVRFELEEQVGIHDKQQEGQWRLVISCLGELGDSYRKVLESHYLGPRQFELKLDAKEVDEKAHELGKEGLIPQWLLTQLKEHDFSITSRAVLERVKRGNLWRIIPETGDEVVVIGYARGVLNVYDPQSIMVIAEQLHISVSSVKVQLHRARQQLARCARLRQCAQEIAHRCPTIPSTNLSTSSIIYLKQELHTQALQIKVVECVEYIKRRELTIERRELTIAEIAERLGQSSDELQQIGYPGRLSHLKALEASRVLRSLNSVLAGDHRFFVDILTCTSQYPWQRTLTVVREVLRGSAAQGKLDQVVKDLKLLPDKKEMLLCENELDRLRALIASDPFVAVWLKIDDSMRQEITAMMIRVPQTVYVLLAQHVLGQPEAEVMAELGVSRAQLRKLSAEARWHLDRAIGLKEDER